MIHLSKDDIQKLAHLSALKLDEQETALLAEHVSAILKYVEQIGEANVGSFSPVRLTNKNIFRDDIAIQRPSQDMLAQAPKRKDNYFVVPQILEQNK